MTVFFRHTKHLLASLALFGVIGMMLAMRPTPTAMERVMTRGELVVMTMHANDDKTLVRPRGLRASRS